MFITRLKIVKGSQVRGEKKATAIDRFTTV